MPDEQVLLIIPKFEGVVAAWNAELKAVSVGLMSGVEEAESINSIRPVAAPVYLPDGDGATMNLTFVA